MSQHKSIITASEIAASIAVISSTYYICRHIFLSSIDSMLIKALAAERFFIKYSDSLFILILIFSFTVSSILAYFNQRKDISDPDLHNRDIISGKNLKTLCIKIHQAIDGDYSEINQIIKKYIKTFVILIIIFVIPAVIMFIFDISVPFLIITPLELTCVLFVVSRRYFSFTAKLTLYTSCLLIIGAIAFKIKMKSTLTDINNTQFTIYTSIKGLESISSKDITIYEDTIYVKCERVEKYFSTKKIDYIEQEIKQPAQ